MINVSSYDSNAGLRRLEHIDRVFSHRNPFYLIFSLIFIVFCVPFGFSFFMASARGEITVNGVPGNGSFQLLPAVFSIVIPLVAVIFSIVLLLTYWNERIEWRNGMISHFNRLGRLTVRAAIGDIYNVFAEDTRFREDYVHDDGFDRSTRRRSVRKIVIETAAGNIQFYEHIRWARELEALAKQAVRDKVPVQEIKAWQG